MHNTEKMPSLSSTPVGSLFAVRAAKVEALFNTLLELPPAQRDRRLAEAALDDPSLEGEVRELLAAHEQAGAGAFMAAPSVDPEFEAAMAAFKSEEPDDVIGRYKLVQQIGVGGFGTVWMAEQTEPMVRKVALKIVQVGMNSKEVISRFEQERQALALMDHPNIAKVFDAGATKHGRPYFVMELVKGIPITQFCDESGYGTRERVALFRDVCAAIQHAHQKGIIHRDIKPSNVMVTLHGETPVVKVIDFGIAKATHGKLTDKTLFTRFEQFIGTPVYMSPEQAALSGLDIDTRSDIYALGVLLYELLTGTPPFDPETLASAGYDEMRRVIREVEPPKPSSRLGTMAGEERTQLAKARRVAAEKIGHLVEPDLDWIVMKAMDKDRNRRFETVNGFAADLQRFLADQPVSARPPSWLYLSKKTFRRHKFGFIATGSIFLALVVGVLASALQAVRATRATEAAQLGAARGAQVAQFMKDMLKGVGPSVALGRDTTLLREILDHTSRRLDELKGQPEVEADLRKTVGELYYEIGKYEEANVMFAQALSLREGRGGEGDLDLAATLLSHAKVLSEQSEFIEAEKLMRRALALRVESTQADSLPVAEALHALAEVTRKQFKLSEAEAFYRRSLTIRRTLLGSHAAEVAESWRGLGRVLWAEGKMADAESALRQAIDIRRAGRGGEDLPLAADLLDLGRMLGAKGDFGDERQARLAEAERCLREALGIRRQLLGVDRSEVVEVLDILFDGLLQARKHAEAEQVAREALAIRRRLPDVHDADLASGLSRVVQAVEAQGKQSELAELLTETNSIQRRADLDPLARAESLERMGDLLWEQGKLVEAEAAYREALELRERVLGLAHRSTIRLRFWIIMNWQAQGRRSEAEQAYRDIFYSQPNDLSELDSVFTSPLYYFANLLQENDKLAEAEATYRASIAQRRRLHGMETASVASPLVDLSRVLRRQGRLDEAESSAREGLALGKKESAHDPSVQRRARYWLALILVDRGQLAEAKSLAIENFSLLDAPDMSPLNRWVARWQLTEILILEKRIDEAEPHLTIVCQGFAEFAGQITSEGKGRLKQSIELFIKECENVGLADKAAQWAATLANLNL